MTTLALQAALVSKPRGASETHDQFLVLNALGQAQWTSDPEVATPFASMREAMRAAMRLPANLKAYGLPRQAELALRRPH